MNYSVRIGNTMENLRFGLTFYLLGMEKKINSEIAKFVGKML